MRECSSLESLSSITLNSYVIHFTSAPSPPWITMEGVRLCPYQVRKRAPDLYGLVEQAGVRVMRLDLYRQESCSDFRDVIVLRKQWLVIAYCDYLYFVSLHTNKVHAHALDGYFGSLEGLANHLLVADARRLMCFDEETNLLWSVYLGIDGVVFAVEGEVVVGEAEIDPPGGWVPFRVALQSGKRLESDAEDRL
jgi:hypothetical protein